MHALAQSASEFPDWQAGTERRLGISMLLGASVVAVVLSLVKLPSPGQVLPLLQFVVELNRREPAAPPEAQITTPRPLPQETENQQIVEPTDSVAATATEEPQNAARTHPDTSTATDAPVAVTPVIDWEVLRDDAVRQVIDESETIVSVNPVFDAKRRDAAIRFRASLAPEKKFIWDNIEKDQLGRNILRDGNCFKVLDDPSVANQYAFETFDQYMVYCEFTFGKKKGRELPWVEEIRQRYPYLRDPVQIP